MTFRPSLALLIALTLGSAGAGLQAQDAAAPAAADATGQPQRKASTLPLKATADEAEAAQLSARFLTRFHYDAQPLDDAMSARVYKAYLDQLDGEKVFFTQADLASFAPLKTRLDDAIWNEDLGAPFSIFNLYVKRATERMRYALGLLDKGFDFSKDESYIVDRDKADWPKDQAELDNLWRERTKNDWLRLKLAGKDEAEIRKTLTKRYTTLVDRIKQLDGEDAFQSFMTAYAETTDPHTDYLGPRLAQNFDISMRLSLEGIGAVLQARDEYTQIREIVPGGPASKSGKLEVGDRIVAIGQDGGPMVDVIGWRLDDVVNKIRGKKDTTVRLEVLPADAGPDGKHELVTLVRKKVVVEEQAAKSKVIEVKDGDVSRKIGVIDLPTFYADFAARSKGDPNYKSATRDVAKLLTELKAQGVQGVIMDLRNNGGGSLDEANELTGLFIDQGPVVQVRKANGEVEVQGDDDAGLAWSGPMAVLVNRGSASASEIFAAAIQDHGRGLIIGEPTFGKGTVQNLVDLDRFAGEAGDSEKPQMGELKMTIAEFFRINGGSTQLKGVTPDIQYPRNGDEKDFGESTYDNALPWTQIAPAPYKPVADLKAYLPQLQQMHDTRVGASPAWKLLLDQLAQYRKMRNQTSISLNLAQRQAERKQQDALQADFLARRKAIDGDVVTGEDETRLDDGLNANERSLKAELKAEKDAKKAKDVELDETAHILFDAVGLIKGDPKLAAEVLPYGGKFSEAPAVAQAPAPAAKPSPAQP
ncbi:carboxy terminal-processing peptidase [Dyella sp.]|jgi:carboxyl-terminal processing protease|uniref:carboxy terminal-processing peptidase n=1 Tax=Dyella sp. TaxID=1869338 RepID=UPI002D76B2EC|nr:carboxy terminal-processing peptidase [Dyella sp.]HET6432877.1 carboxy terminal-processing peptidase [Dyella sp.]